MKGSDVLGMHMQEEMCEQPAVLGRIAQRAEEIGARVREVVPSELAGVALVARGSSDNAALFGRYLIEVGSRRPVGLVAPSVHTRLRAEVDYSGYLVVALSQSGETPEIVSSAVALKGAGAVVVGVVNGTTNPLARACDLTIDLEAGPEVAVPSTKAVTAQMAVLVTIAGVFADAPHRDGLLDPLAAAVDEVLRRPEPPRALASMWSSHEKLVVAGRGPAVAAAHEIALKIRETARVFAEGGSAADLLHGPVSALGQGTPAILVDAGGPWSTDLSSVRDRLLALGVPVATMAPDAGAEIPLPSELDELLQPICAVVRGQQLALEWSRALGVDPDAPVGLAKVTPTT